MVIVAVHCDTVREDAAFEALLATVSAYRREKVAALRMSEEKRRSLCAGLALDACLRTVGLREAEQTYAIEQHGRSVLAAHPEWHFSLSHGGDFAVCALSEAPVGVDVEKLRPVRAEALARRFFSEEEAAAVSAAVDEERCRVFFKLWTAKESVLKAQGIGLGGGLARAAATPPFVLKEYALPEHVLCVCGCGAFPEKTIIFSCDSDLPR